MYRKLGLGLLLVGALSVIGGSLFVWSNRPTTGDHSVSSPTRNTGAGALPTPTAVEIASPTVAPPPADTPTADLPTAPPTEDSRPLSAMAAPTTEPPVVAPPLEAAPVSVPNPDARPTALDPVPDPHQDGVRWFAETGHTLRGGFRSLWERAGGLVQFGYPLSEEFQEVIPPASNPVTVQYFERNRFEWHTEYTGTPNEFLLGLLGREITNGAAFPTSPPFGSSPTHHYFPETQHSIGGAFLSYWRVNGGLAVYGLPISEEILEQEPSDGRVYLVQYFERNRFELHPEQRATPSEIQLGLLGTDVLRKRGWLH